MSLFEAVVVADRQSSIDCAMVVIGRISCELNCGIHDWGGCFVGAIKERRAGRSGSGLLASALL